MPAPIVYIIRHAEKPAHGERAIDKNGKHSDHSLTARGWMRAGALVRFFSQPQVAGLQVPQTIVAANPKAPGADRTSTSKREMETANPLAAYLGHAVDTTHGVGEEEAVAIAARAAEGPVLIVWDHKRILDLVRRFGVQAPLPAKWPGTRFDLVFVLRPSGKVYGFEQVPQQLLAGDTDTLLQVV